MTRRGRPRLEVDRLAAQLMRSLGMSARETAARLGISPRTLGRILSLDDSQPRSAPANDPARGTYPAAKFKSACQAPSV